MAPASAAQRRRKRRKYNNRVSIAPGTPSLSKVLPCVSKAPAVLEASHRARFTYSKTAGPPPHQRSPFLDNSDLEAQISKLSLIYKYGYGPDPGIPSVPCRIGSFRRRYRTTTGIVTAWESRPVSLGFTSKGGTSAGKCHNTNARNSFRTARESWIESFDFEAGLERPHRLSRSKVTSADWRFVSWYPSPGLRE